VLRVSDRVAVIKDREMIAEMHNDNITEHDIMAAIAGGTK
jgi:monosaccharide-transporting ATPase